MPTGGFTPAEWIVLVERELFLFAGIFFFIGAIDEFAVDLAWLWLRLTGRAKTSRLAADASLDGELTGRCAVFLPAWHEEAVIGATVRHMTSAWPQRDVRFYVGTYRNDPATARAAIAGAGGDARFRLVIHDREGPSTKADCLNRLYRALETDEERSGIPYRMVVMHDAEDMVDPAALVLLDAGVGVAEVVQLPVVPEPLASSRWIASHYCEEFAEAHAKAMVVRDALGAGLPTAGVGCAIARHALGWLARQRGADGPFAAECLTEDYELGLGIADLGGRTRFVRARAADGPLIATRAVFPDRIDWAVRQKTRWIHGIALQSWDRLGWSDRPADMWMRLRDRRGPFTALVLFIAYLLLALFALGLALQWVGIGAPFDPSPALMLLLALNLASFVWRAAFRFAFTAREYGAVEGLRAILRIPVANIIAIMAGRRALTGYIATLWGRTARWDKTRHAIHPDLLVSGQAT